MKVFAPRRNNNQRWVGRAAVSCEEQLAPLANGEWYFAIRRNRVRKKKTSSPNKVPSSKKNVSSAKLPRDVREFLNEVGSFIEYWGFKRVQGEIWGLVYLSSRPLTATEIARQLHVSKALISLAMGELLDHGVLVMIDSVDGRQRRLVPNENLGEAISGVLRIREKKMLSRTAGALEKIKHFSARDLQRHEISEPRLSRLADFIATANSGLTSLLLLWKS